MIPHAAPRSRRLADVVDRGARILRRTSETPRLDAELLVAHALGVRRLDLHRDPEQVVPSEGVRRIAGLVRRRALGQPVAYLLGEREFGALTFAVDSRVLVPRPETELVVDEAVDRLRQVRESARGREARLLDLGTGSGAIAVATAYRVPGVRVLAVDRSSDALRVARRNAARHGVSHRVRFACGDWLASMREGSRYDVIASNPPYIPEAAMDSLPRDVRDHEPRGALCSGDDAFVCHRAIADAAFEHLRPGGWLLLETGGERGRPDPSRFEWLERYHRVAWIPDLAGLARVLVARRPDSRRVGGGSEPTPRGFSFRRECPTES